MELGSRSILLLEGDDELAIARALLELRQGLGDPAWQEMNTSRLEGKNLKPGDLLNIAGAAPFFVERRLVIVDNLCAQLDPPPNATREQTRRLQEKREEYLRALERIPASALVVLVENRSLSEGSDEKGKEKKPHWLVDWAARNAGRVAHQAFRLPRGAALVTWIQAQVKAAGGQITPAAARLLVELVGEHPRLIEQEINKLLAYVNYKRKIDEVEVHELTADTAEGNIFTLVDAIAARNHKRAMDALLRLWEEADPGQIFGMVVRQFRLLLLAKEAVEARLPQAALLQALGTQSNYYAEKITSQARPFTLAGLEDIYRRLNEMDAAMKSSRMDALLAFQVLIAGLTA